LSRYIYFINLKYLIFYNGASILDAQHCVNNGPNLWNSRHRHCKDNTWQQSTGKRILYYTYFLRRKVNYDIFAKKRLITIYRPFSISRWIQEWNEVKLKLKHDKNINYLKRQTYGLGHGHDLTGRAAVQWESHTDTHSTEGIQRGAEPCPYLGENRLKKTP
jgi:hypothetical protein